MPRARPRWSRPVPRMPTGSAPSLTGQAGVLARGLAFGAPCPVCGSLEHPHPAALASEVPTQEQVDAAAAALDRATAQATEASAAASSALANAEACEAELARERESHGSSDELLAKGRELGLATSRLPRERPRRQRDAWAS